VVGIEGLDLAASARVPIFFSCQLLLRASPIEAPSISLWAEEILNHLEARGEAFNSPWLLHVFDPLTAETGVDYARPRLIREAFISLLKRKNRGLLRSLEQRDSSKLNLVQVVAYSKSRGFIGFTSSGDVAQFGASISPNPAGYCVVADDKAPPSRAYKKLLEAIDVFRLDIKRGSRVVDLGAAPGGWTYVLLKLGARVTAVDRSELDVRLTRTLKGSGNLVSVIGDALKWVPTEPVDWLVCDVITTPENTARMVRRWIDGGFCRNFCVTFKFKGDVNLASIIELIGYLKDKVNWIDGKQLTNNKNELTLVGGVAVVR
jgi:23S rRNA C2498 (ribose-2'-O)-methylase RlmM